MTVPLPLALSTTATTAAAPAVISLAATPAAVGPNGREQETNVNSVLVLGIVQPGLHRLVAGGRTQGDLHRRQAIGIRFGRWRGDDSAVGLAYELEPDDRALDRPAALAGFHHQRIGDGRARHGGLAGSRDRSQLDGGSIVGEDEVAIGAGSQGEGQDGAGA
jgi:hypothetical protein